MKFLGFEKLSETLYVMFYDEKNDKLNNYFIQISFKDMWYKPHKEYLYKNNSVIYGWLFFYFGNIISK
jgi:hypothetical protein